MSDCRSGGLATDFYELTMAASYLRHAMAGHATFSLFLRRLPPGRGFVVAAGLDDCLDFLEDFHFEPDELSYLAELGFDDQVIDQFRRLRFVPRGTFRRERWPPSQWHSALPLTDRHRLQWVSSGLTVCRTPIS